jgi:hypothetical protein
MNAPIVLFVYKRLFHTKKVIESLQKNDLAPNSEIFIFSDGARKGDEKEVKNVRNYLKNIIGFKKITLIEREKNYGLKQNVILGVNEIIDKYGKVIVLEDDLVVSPYFLKFMNEALNFYENKKNVWHISGWNYPIYMDLDKDTYFLRIMNCWGWATWKDRWKNLVDDVDYFLNSFSKEEIRRFNLDGAYNFYAQLKANKKGLLNTWAIFWYATIFKNGGLCVNATRSFVANIGLDGSGENCGIGNDNIELNVKKNFIFDDSLKENKKAIELIKKYYKRNKKPIFLRLKAKFKYWIGK